MIESFKDFLRRECSDRMDGILKICEHLCLFAVAACWITVFLVACAYIGD